MDYEAAKRMEDFAKEILRQTPTMQEKLWKALESVLAADEIHGLKCYVGLFRMFNDQRYFEAVKKSVGEQLYNELHKLTEKGGRP